MTKLTVDHLRRIQAEDVSAYMLANHWRREASGYDFADAWVRDSNTAVIPTRADLRDYPLRVAQALEVIASVEKRDPASVLNDILIVGTDVVKLRLPTVGAFDDISFGTGVKLVEQGMALLTAAACSAVTARAVLPKRRPHEAIDYLNHVRMGQTQRGSFILTIMSPVAPLLTPGVPGLLELIGDSFPRRVTRMLARALNAVGSATETTNNSGSFTPFQEAIPSGVSAELCEALSGMLRTTQELDVKLSWSSKLAAPEERSAFTFTPEQGGIFAEAAVFLRRTEPLEGIAVTGTVINLHREDGSQPGSITVSCHIDEQLRKLTVALPPEDYDAAIVAHREKQGVYFRADVAKVGNRFVATSVNSFRVLTED